MRKLFETTFLLLGWFVVKIVVTPTRELAKQVKNGGVYLITITFKTREFVFNVTPTQVRPVLEALEEELSWKALRYRLPNFAAFFVANVAFVHFFHPEWPMKLFWTAIAYVIGGLMEYVVRHFWGKREPFLLSFAKWTVGAVAFTLLYCGLELIYPAGTSILIAKAYSLVAGSVGIAVEWVTGAALAWAINWGKKRLKKS